MVIEMSRQNKTGVISHLPDGRINPEWRHLWRQRFLDRERARGRARDKARAREVSRASYLRHHEEELAKRAAWRKAHPELKRAQDAASHQLHRETRLDKQRLYRERNRDYLRARGRANHATRVANDPGYNAQTRHIRRARLAAVRGAFTSIEWREKQELFGQCCAYCGQSRRLTVDHRVPLSRGGNNEIQNIVPACMGCNLRKGTKTDSEFIAMRLQRGS